jgi:ribonuclease VapC
MIVDTSAVVAILFYEEDAEKYAHAMAEADSRRMSAASFVEAAIVIETQTSSTPLSGAPASPLTR